MIVLHGYMFFLLHFY